MPGVVKVFRHYIREINHKLDVNDPNYLKIGIKCGEIEQLCELMYPLVPPPGKHVETEIEKVIKKREKFDKSIQRQIDEEKSNIFLVKVGLAFIFLGGGFMVVNNLFELGF